MRFGSLLVASILIQSAAALAAEPIRPEVEVSSAAGAVQVTLRVYKTKIAAGDYPWVQIGLKNVGGEELPVFDHKVFDDFWALRANAQAGRSGLGLFIEVRGPDGERLGIEPARNVGPDLIDEDSGLLETRT